MICSDKTGTLTQNEMTVVQGWAGGKRFKVSGEGYSPMGQFSMNGQPFDPLKDLSASLLLHAGLLCNDAKLEESGEEKGEKAWRMIGDPTEGAMVVAAAKARTLADGKLSRFPRVSEIPFDSDRKRMTTIHQKQNTGGNFLLRLPLHRGLCQGRAGHDAGNLRSHCRGR